LDRGRLRQGRSETIETQLENIKANFGEISDSDILEIGCGDGLNTILLAMNGAQSATGIDLDLRFDNDDTRGETVRNLMQKVLLWEGREVDLEKDAAKLPAKLHTMNATKMSFPDESFDLAVSNSALEHVHPIEGLFNEIYRALRPGGMTYHEIDPYYWVRGCHKRGVVDIPWAHARLSLEEYRKFVLESEGEEVAEMRFQRLDSLNRLTSAQWRTFIESTPFEIMEWVEDTSPFAEEVLRDYPGVVTTLMPNVTKRDLVISRIKFWLRKPV